jgi:hypothetical protein
MRPGILRGEALLHPCDVAFGTLLAPMSDAALLYLIEQPRLQAPNHGIRAIAAGISAAEFLRDFKANEDLELPLADGSLHLVMLVLPSAWPASARAQWRLLCEIRRVLAESGQLLILTANRYGYSRLRGLLRPQRLLRSPRLAKDGAWLPSKRALRHLLERGGFHYTEWFRPARDRQGCLARVFPLGATRDSWSAQRPSSVGARIRNSSWFTDDFLIRATVAKPGRSALQHCLDAAAGQMAGPGGSMKAQRIERLLVTPKEKVVVLATLGERRVVLRIPLSSSALQACRRNVAALRALGTSGGGKDIAPAPLAEGYCAGYYYAVESRVRGQPMLALPAQQAGLTLIERLIRRLNPQAVMRKLDGAFYERLVSAPLAKIAPVISMPAKREALERMFSAELLGQRIAAGITHGDLSLRNVFVENDSVSGVIDWDESSLSGCPILDAVSHVCSRQFRRGGAFADTISRLARRQWPHAEELAFLDRCYEHFGMDQRCHAALVFLYWLNATGPQLDLWFARDPDFVRRRVHEVVEAIIGRDS